MAIRQLSGQLCVLSDVLLFHNNFQYTPISMVLLLLLGREYISSCYSQGCKASHSMKHSVESFIIRNIYKSEKKIMLNDEISSIQNISSIKNTISCRMTGPLQLFHPEKVYRSYRFDTFCNNKTVLF